MIISQTPLRISFLGGGTDYPGYYRKYGGLTIAAAINQYTYVTINPLASFFKHKIGLHYSEVEKVESIDELKHPSVRECLRYMGIDSGLEIHIATDLPARSGLGSSSSFTVGFLKALHEYKSIPISNFDLARLAVDIEQNMIKERVGSQDQFSCALPGIKLINFDNDDNIRINHLENSRVYDLKKYLMLFYTGIQRLAHQILEQQVNSTENGILDSKLEKIKEIAQDGYEILNSTHLPLEEFGHCIGKSWELKKQLSNNISSEEFDLYYDKAITAGAIGGKLLGAGGGGFMLFFVPLEKQGKVCQSLAPLQLVPFDFSLKGSSIIFSKDNS